MILWLWKLLKQNQPLRSTVHVIGAHELHPMTPVLRHLFSVPDLHPQCQIKARTPSRKRTKFYSFSVFNWTKITPNPLLLTAMHRDHRGHMHQRSAVAWAAAIKSSTRLERRGRPRKSEMSSTIIAGTMIVPIVVLYDQRFVRMQVRPQSAASSLPVDGDGDRRLAKSGHAN